MPSLQRKHAHTPAMNFQHSAFPEYVSFFADILAAQGHADDMYWSENAGAYVFAFDIEEEDKEVWPELAGNKRVLFLVDTDDSALLAVALEDFKEAAGFLLHSKGAGDKLC